jgi:hypothetical protein
MATLLQLRTAILDISKNHYIQTDSDVELTDRINAAVLAIAAGIRMPNGQVSPPLPDLFTTLTVATATDAAFKTLGATYQRKVFKVIDSSGDQIACPSGGDYYSFNLFLNRLQDKDMTESGSIYICAVKGSNLYYQGIPSVSENLTVYAYRKPVDMAASSSTPDGIPEHLQTRLIKHYVGKELANEMVDGMADKQKYHETEFYKAMFDLLDYIGDDSEPQYYHSDMDGSYDAGICD